MFKLQTISYTVSEMIRLLALLFPVPAKMAYYRSDDSDFEEGIRDIELTDERNLISITRQALAKQHFQELEKKQNQFSQSIKYQESKIILSLIFYLVLLTCLSLSIEQVVSRLLVVSNPHFNQNVIQFLISFSIIGMFFPVIFLSLTKSYCKIFEAELNLLCIKQEFNRRESESYKLF